MQQYRVERICYVDIFQRNVNKRGALDENLIRGTRARQQWCDCCKHAKWKKYVRLKTSIQKLLPSKKDTYRISSKIRSRFYFINSN